MDVTTILFLLSDGKQQAPYFCFRMASRTSLHPFYHGCDHDFIFAFRWKAASPLFLLSDGKPHIIETHLQQS
jgi:hypothetical protein